MPHDSNPHGFHGGRRIYITQHRTDGFAGYPKAVDVAFAGYAKCGTIIDEYRNASMTYTPSEMFGTKRDGIFGTSPWKNARYARLTSDGTT